MPHIGSTRGCRCAVIKACRMPLCGVTIVSNSALDFRVGPMGLMWQNVAHVTCCNLLVWFVCVTQWAVVGLACTSVGVMQC